MLYYIPLCIIMLYYIILGYIRGLRLIEVAAGLHGQGSHKRSVWLTDIGGSYLSNATCLTHVLLKSGE